MVADEGTIAVLCSCGRKRLVYVYCAKHTEVICSICGINKHIHCATCPVKDKVTNDTEKIFREALDKAKTIRATMESCKQDIESDRNKLETEKELCKKEIAAFRRDINTILDKMENNINESLEAKAIDQLNRIGKQIAALAGSIIALDKDLEVVDNANKISTEEMMFPRMLKFQRVCLSMKNLSMT